MSDELARIAIALVAVLGMIGGGAMLAKRLGLAAPGGALAGKRRLSVVESMVLDARRRVAIIRCDDAEHLILLGSNGETVIDRHIGDRNIGSADAGDAQDGPIVISDSAAGPPAGQTAA